MPEAAVLEGGELFRGHQSAKGRFDEHRRIARITFPVWLYVSLTGVVIYWMNHHLRPHV